MTASTFKGDAVDSEAPSTSCSEDLPHVREQAVSARGAGKAVMAAMVMALIAIAGVSWTRNYVAVGEKSIGLEGTAWYSAGNFGCTNWRDILLSREVTEDKAACATRCASEHMCTSYNFQKDACDPPAGTNQSYLCLLLHGACFPQNNTCWQLSYRAIGTSSIRQNITVLTSTHPVAEDVGLCVKAAVEEGSGFSPVVVHSSEILGPRLNTSYIEYIVEWSYSAPEGGETATTYSMKLADDAATVVDFVDKLRAANPAIGVTGVNASYPTLGFATEVTA